MAEAMNEGRALLSEEKGEDLDVISAEETQEVLEEVLSEGDVESFEEETTEEA
jgi:small subunit ribosomal protein S2